MTDQQFNKLLNVLTTQAVVLHGILNVLQSIGIKQGAQVGGIQFKDAQKIFDATASSIKVP